MVERDPSPGRGYCVVFLGKTLLQCLSPPRYNWLPANLLLGVALQWTSNSSERSRKIPVVALYYRNRDKLLPDGPLGSYAGLPYFTCLLWPAKVQLAISYLSDIINFTQ